MRAFLIAAILFLSSTANAAWTDPDPAVFQIRCKNGVGTVYGTCFCIGLECDQAVIVTCAHCEGGDYEILKGGVWYKAKSVHHNKELDVRVLLAPKKVGEFAYPLADEAPPEKTKAAFAAIRSRGTWKDWTVISKEMSGLTTQDGVLWSSTPFIQGDSGGPVIFENKVVGMVFATTDATGFVVDLASLKKVVEVCRQNYFCRPPAPIVPTPVPVKPPQSIPEPDVPDKQDKCDDEMAMLEERINQIEINISQEVDQNLDSAIESAVKAWCEANLKGVDKPDDQDLDLLSKEIAKRLPPIYPMWIDDEGNVVDEIPGGVRLGQTMPLRIGVLYRANAGSD